MSTDLRITPARRALLQAINDGAVTIHYAWLTGASMITLDRGPDAPWPPGRRIRVTKAAEALVAAGLARIPPLGGNMPHPLALTDAGRERLGGGS